MKGFILFGVVLSQLVSAQQTVYTGAIVAPRDDSGVGPTPTTRLNPFDGKAQVPLKSYKSLIYDSGVRSFQRATETALAQQSKHVSDIPTFGWL
jgi:hypothetical protein